MWKTVAYYFLFFTEVKITQAPLKSERELMHSGSKPGHITAVSVEPKNANRTGTEKQEQALKPEWKYYLHSQCLERNHINWT